MDNLNGVDMILQRFDKLDQHNDKVQLMMKENSDALKAHIENTDRRFAELEKQRLQDKMEFDDMVINFGLRYDLFDPNSDFPSHSTRLGPEHSF